MVRKVKKQVLMGWEIVTDDAAATLKNNTRCNGHQALEMVSEPGGRKIFLSLIFTVAMAMYGMRGLYFGVSSPSPWQTNLFRSVWCEVWVGWKCLWEQSAGSLRDRQPPAPNTCIPAAPTSFSHPSPGRHPVASHSQPNSKGLGHHSTSHS